MSRDDEPGSPQRCLKTRQSYAAFVESAEARRDFGPQALAAEVVLYAAPLTMPVWLLTA